MFHDFGSKRDKYTISIKKFERIINKFEKESFGFITLNEIDKTGYDKFVCLTFDDGYKSQLEIAKILHRKKIKGNFFIITDNIGKKGYLDKEDLIFMKELGMEIGSHSHSHKDMRILSEKDFESELKKSKRILEDLLKQKVNSFSFPGGNYKKEQLEIAKKIFGNVRTSDPIVITEKNMKIYPGIGISRKIRTGLLYNKNFIHVWNVLKIIKNSKNMKISYEGIFHVHSIYSDGKLSLREILGWAEKNKIKYVLMSDHAEFFDDEKYELYKKECEKISSKEIQIIPGIEINAAKGDHIIILNPKKLPHEKDENKILSWAEKNNLVAIVAHARIGKYCKKIKNIELWNRKRDRGFMDIKSLNEIKKAILRNPLTRLYAGTDWHGSKGNKILFGLFEEKNKKEKDIIKKILKEKILFSDGKIGFDTEGNIYGQKKEIILELLKTEVFLRLKQNLRKVKIFRTLYHKIKK